MSELRIKESMICTKCNGNHFTVKREATFLYSYKLDTPDTGQWSKDPEALPFLFDYRELIDSHEYLQCEKCGARFPCSLDDRNNTINFTIEGKAVRSDNVNNPEYLG
jgi:ribosomal protein L40E